MKAVIKKVKATGFDEADQIQIRVKGEEVDSEILEIRRGDKCRIKVEGVQTTMKTDKDGVVIEPEIIEFETETISISICVSIDEQIATITMGCADKDIAKQILNKNLRGVLVNVSYIPST